MSKSLIQKLEGVIEDLGIISNYQSQEDGCRHEVHGLIRKLDENIVLTLKVMLKHSSMSSSDHQHLNYVDFDAEGVTALNQTIQQIKEPDSLTPVSLPTTTKETGFFKKIFQKVKDGLRMSGVIYEFGVISNFCDEKNKRQCEVKAALRKPDDQYVLTLTYKNKHYGSSESAFVDLDENGISGLERMIQKLRDAA
jgi:hypothetical protein